MKPSEWRIVDFSSIIKFVNCTYPGYEIRTHIRKSFMVRRINSPIINEPLLPMCNPEFGEEDEKARKGWHSYYKQRK